MHPPIPVPVSSSPVMDSVDVSPLLRRNHRILPRNSQPLRGAAARLLRRASSRRMMLREPSVRVRENAAEQIEERQSEWAYSKPIIILDVIWNLAFMVVSMAVLGFSLEEKPGVPLRLWIIGYNLLCLFHVGCVLSEYRRRRESNYPVEESDSNPEEASDDSDDYDTEEALNEHETSLAKHLEPANTIFSFVWWIIGFYWITADTDNLSQISPRLYWICVAFMTFDVIFVVICIAVASLIGIAVCCCLPCIIAILYALADQEGATDEEIERIPKFKFRTGEEIRETHGGIMTELNVDSPIERALSNDDAECCICLCSYEDGVELRELNCNHHFHSDCIDKWLSINAICPLCKFNILKNGDPSGNDEQV